jgi:hypothetical protein
MLGQITVLLVFDVARRAAMRLGEVEKNAQLKLWFEY